MNLSINENSIGLQEKQVANETKKEINPESL
jgi:hypothetical protein